MSTSRAVAVSLAALIAVGLAGCDGKPSRGGPVAVTATDTACDLGRTEVSAGVTTFKVVNKGSKVTEFYVYGSGDRVMAEVENVAPGVTRDLTVELPPGEYETACKPGMTGKGIRGPLTVTGTATPLSGDAKVAAAVDSYQRYVRSQTAALVDKTKEFVAAVKSGDTERAKALYPVARTYWERIEPVAEIFGDLDPAIDGREGDLEPGVEFTGFHRLEKDLWETRDLSKSALIADKLMADINEIVAKANDEKLTVLQLANGAKELLDEVATMKITGEEDRYSHTDLWDFAANLEGSKAAVAALRPVLDERAPALGASLDAAFATAGSTLDRHRRGDGWRLHNELSQSELKELSDAINALGEPVSKVAAVVAK